MNNATPVVLLDVDGVLNACTSNPDPTIWPAWKDGRANGDTADGSAPIEITHGGIVASPDVDGCGMMCAEPVDRARDGMLRVGECALPPGHGGAHDPYPPHAHSPKHPVGPLAAYRYAASALRTEQARRFLPAALGPHGAVYAAGWDAAADWLLHIALPLTEGDGK